MEYYCENCGHVSDFGDFCFNCESPNMIPMNQPKNGHTPEIAEKITNRNNDQSLDQIAQRLAASVVTNPGENPGEMKITLGGFYYRKYGEYDVNYRVNGSTCSLCLVEIPLSTRDTFPECREARRMAIVELDRFMWNGMLQGKNMTEYNVPQNVKRLKETRIHPTQKPVTLYKWLFRNFVKEGDKVLDTHGGSMSSAIAAYDFGDGVFDLCEIDPAYFAAGKQRFEAYSSQGKLF